jgi:hypothetical protein
MYSSPVTGSTSGSLTDSRDGMLITSWNCNRARVVRTTVKPARQSKNRRIRPGVERTATSSR